LEPHSASITPPFLAWQSLEAMVSLLLQLLLVGYLLEDRGGGGPNIET
jgi:hypothetical protein